MTRPTSGPWFYGHKGIKHLWVGPSHDSAPVALVPHDMHNKSRYNSRVNAALLSASPSMLEALKNLENDDGSIPDHAWNMVQDAIAKAEA